MPARTARALAQSPADASVGEDLQPLVALAVAVTERPQAVAPAEIAAARQAAGSWPNYLDAVNVIIAFNFVTRIANALGVEPDLLPWLRAGAGARGWAAGLIGAALRGMDLRPRHLPTRPVAENLGSLDRLFVRVGLGPLPEVFSELRAAPHVLESQRELFEALLEPDAGSGEAGLDPERFLMAGLVTLQEVSRPADVLRQRVWSWFEQQGRVAPERLLAAAAGSMTAVAPRDAVLLRFVRDMTACSSSLTSERVEELRQSGLTDTAILDRACAVAVWNASGRLEILLADLARPAEPAPSAAARHAVMAGTGP
jgi:alkylhydroperoxidase family enzyme